MKNTFNQIIIILLRRFKWQPCGAAGPVAFWYHDSQTGNL